MAEIIATITEANMYLAFRSLALAARVSASAAGVWAWLERVGYNVLRARCWGRHPRHYDLGQNGPDFQQGWADGVTSPNGNQ
jgi:hypothetical protein